MRRERLRFRLATAAAVTGLAATLLPPAARAQQPEIPPPSAINPEVNPPARVGAVTRVRGGVSFHAAGADSWSPAEMNYPVTTGEGFWTQPGAEARIAVSDTSIVLAGGTELEISTLDEATMVATLPQGEAYIQVLDLQPGETYTIVTPRGSVTIGAAGQYFVVAGDTATPTLFAVLNGEATLGEGVAGDMTSGQAAEITGDAAPFQLQAVAAQPDAFVQHVLAEEQPRPAPAVAVPALVERMPGGAALAEYGTWTPSPQYGDVWYPRVASDWVPYREGHWAYVAPWGWTWVDSDAWGFAPFHYGRWIDEGGRWGWTPGYEQPVEEAPEYPVYAPALVTFFGIGLAAGVGAALYDRGSVGWVPLGPNEAYRPWYHAGPQYIRDVNIRHVRNLTQITEITNNRTTINNVTINRFRDAPGATLVPAAAMAASRPLARVAQRPSAEVLAQARPVVGREPIRPSVATAGVTPAIARAVGAGPAPSGIPERRAAPGPEIHARDFAIPAAVAGAAAVAGGAAAHHFAKPPLARPGGGGASVRGPEPGAPPGVAGHPGEHPGPAAPALRGPGAGPPAHPSEAAGRPGGAPAGAEAIRHPGAPTEHSGAPPIAQPRLETPGAHPAAPTQAGRPEIPTHAIEHQPPTPGNVAHEAPKPAAPGVPAVHAPAVPPPLAHEAVHPAPPFHSAEPARPAAPALHPAPETMHPAAPVSHPAAPPAYHPPEAVRPAAPAFHPAPAPAYHPPEAARPAAPAFHPAPAPAYHPPEAARPAAPVFHPAPAPAYHPAPAPANHPAPAARPAPPAFHPAPPPAAARPAARPQERRPG